MRKFDLLIAETLPHSVVSTEMKRLQQLRINDEIRDTLILVQHPEVVTVGPRARATGVTIPEDYQTVSIDRGGGITWHGEGQLVAYPIFKWDLSGEANVAVITEKIEQWVINTLNPLGITGVRNDAMQGVWVADKKVASIGLNFLKWTSRHGFTINYDTPPSRVENLQCCGMSEGTTTSLSRVGHTGVTRSSLTALLLGSSQWSVNRSVGKIYPFLEADSWPI